MRTMIPLGTCAVTYNLKDRRKDAYPFDWSSFTIKQLINVLNENFKDYTDIIVKYFSEKHGLMSDVDTVDFKGSLVLTNKYKIIFAHEIINKYSIDEFKYLLEKRIERFRAVENPTFVRIESKNLSQKQMNKTYGELITIFDKLYVDWKMILISKLNIDEPHPKIKHYELTFSSNWKYPEIDWEHIFDSSL